MIKRVSEWRAFSLLLYFIIAGVLYIRNFSEFRVTDNPHGFVIGKFRNFFVSY